MSNNSKMSNMALGVMFSISAGFCWGTFGVARALGPANATSISVSGFRLLFSAIGLCFMAYTMKAFQNSGPITKWPWPSMALSGIGLGGFTFLYLESMYRAGVSIGTPVGCASIPVISAILEAIIYKQKPSFGQVLGMITVILGVTAISYDPNEFAEGVDTSRRFSGIMFAIASGLVFSLYSLSIQKNIKKIPNLTVQACVFSAAAVFMLPISILTTDCTWMRETSGIASAVWLGLVSGALGYYFYIRSMKLIPVSIATTLSMVEPLTAALLGYFLLKEQMHTVTLVGLIVLFIGIFVVSQATARRKMVTA